METELPKIELSDYKKYKKSYQLWQKNNREHLNEYYRNYRKQKKILKEEQIQKDIIKNYLIQELKKN